LLSHPPMPFGALCLSLFTGYIFDQVLAQEELKVGEEKTKRFFFKLWVFLLRFVIPIVILIVFITQFI